MKPIYSNCWLSADHARLGWGRWRICPHHRFLVRCLKASVWATLLACICGAPARTWGYTSASPEVQQMLERAIPYLETNGRTTDGVEYLKKTQLSDGSWHTQGSHIRAPMHTAFAVLQVMPQMIQDVDELLNSLNSTEDKGFDPSSLPGGLSLNQDLTKRNRQLERVA